MVTEEIILPVVPIPKPRQTRRDVFNPSNRVIAYRSFADKLRMHAQKVGYIPGFQLSLTFVIPMPESWSEKKKCLHDGEPHRQRPDLDNLIKAFKDALYKKVKGSDMDDCQVWYYGSMKKVWGRTGEIRVHPNE